MKKCFTKPCEIKSILKQDKRFSAGFTLTELIIITAISAIVGLIIANMLSIGIKTFSRQSETVSFQVETRTELNRLKNDILGGYKIVRQYPEAAAVPTYKTSANQIIIAVPSIGPAPNHDWIYDSNQPKLDYFIYWTDASNRMHKRIIANPDPLNNRDNVADTIISQNAVLAFKYKNDNTIIDINTDSVDDINKIKAKLIISKNVRGKIITSEDTIEVNLRNK